MMRAGRELVDNGVSFDDTQLVARWGAPVVRVEQVAREMAARG